MNNAVPVHELERRVLEAAGLELLAGPERRQPPRDRLPHLLRRAVREEGGEGVSQGLRGMGRRGNITLLTFAFMTINVVV